QDGVVRIHDLVQRTTRPVLELGAPVMARFADDDRRLVIWHDDRLTVLDPATGRRRDVTVPVPIHDLEVVRDLAYWVDTRGALWRLPLDGAAPTGIALDEPVHALAPSPGGRWIALSGEHHLFLLDRSQPAAPAIEVMIGTPREVAWSADGEYLGALIDDF